MKKEVTVTQKEYPALTPFVGKNVTVGCNFIYYGVLKSVDEDTLTLSNPKMVYDTGSWSDKDYKLEEEMPSDEVVIFISKIEFFGELKAK